MALASARAIGIEHEQLNVNGGAKRGIATLCIGVGQGMAMLLENPAAG